MPQGLQECYLYTITQRGRVGQGPQSTNLKSLETPLLFVAEENVGLEEQTCWMTVFRISQTCVDEGA